MIYDIWYMICITNDTLHIQLFVYRYMISIQHKKCTYSLAFFFGWSLFLSKQVRSSRSAKPWRQKRSGWRTNRITSCRKPCRPWRRRGLQTEKNRGFPTGKKPQRIQKFVISTCGFHFVDFLWGQSCCGLPGQGRIARNRLRQKTQELL